MFNNFTDVRASQESAPDPKQMKNPYLSQLGTFARPERRSQEVLNHAKKSAGPISEHSEVSFVDEAVNEPKVLRTSASAKIHETLQHDGGEIDQGSIGASSRGIQPYSKRKSSSRRQYGDDKSRKSKI